MTTSKNFATNLSFHPPSAAVYASKRPTQCYHSHFSQPHISALLRSPPLFYWFSPSHALRLPSAHKPPTFTHPNASNAHHKFQLSHFLLHISSRAYFHFHAVLLIFFLLCINISIITNFIHRIQTYYNIALFQIIFRQARPQHFTGYQAPSKSITMNEDIKYNNKLQMFLQRKKSVFIYFIVQYVSFGFGK